jgi:hypothetical protein
MILKLRTGVLASPQYFRVPSLPAVLGRGSSSDVWIAHPQISASHARLERREDGKYWVVDLGSRNGLRKDGAAVTEAPIETGQVFELGTLRFEVDLEDGLEERTETIVLNGHDRQFLGQSRQEWALNFLCLAAQGAAFWLGSYYRFPDSEMMEYSTGRAVLTLPIGFGLAVFLSLLSKLHGGEYRYWSFFRRSSLALTGAWVAWLSSEIIAFNLPGSQGSWLVSCLLFGGWLLGTGYSISRIVFAEQPKQRVLRWVAGADACLVVFALIAATVLRDSSYGFDGVYSVPLIQWSRPTTQQAISTLDRQIASATKKREKVLEKEKD